MNLLLLLAGLRVWTASSSTALLTGIFVAVSVLSIEIQAVTWIGAGSLRGLVIVNALTAVVALTLSWRGLRAGVGATTAPDLLPALNWGITSPRRAVRVRDAVPWPAIALLGVLVLALNVIRPLEAADPYHFDKVAQIERTGTWTYDLQADKKVNILSSVYELVLADVRQIPALGGWLVRLHGVGLLLLYLVAIAAARELLQAGAGWPWAALLAVPVVFHQMVLVKNDLFVAVPAFVVLTWVIARARLAGQAEFLWAAWLAAMVVAIKLTSLPLLLIVAAAAAMRRTDRWRLVGAVAAGSLAGLVSGGLIFILIENIQWYGELMPAADISSRYAGNMDRLVGTARFAISLVDLGLVTRAVWPGRGGWGGTFGLPLIWAVAVLALRARSNREARWALALAALQFLAFAIVFPDADVAQRLASAPALLLIAIAVFTVQADATLYRRARLALMPVLLLSAAQIVRSAVLYLRPS
jgi:hypothetical protein